MYSFDIFADSAANLPDDIVEQYAIGIIPYTLIINGEERPALEQGKPYRESAKEFYALMRSGADMKTSLIPTEAFKSALAPTLEAGRDALLITITAGLSGTNAQALAAKQELEATYPDRKVFVVDSANASLGQGLLVLGAARLRDEGKSAEECANWVEENRYSINSQVTVAELKYLHRSGRVSGVLAFAGTLLNIKPMLRADGNSPAQLVVYGKEKGRKKSLAEIRRAFEENVVNPEGQTMAIAHADCEEEAQELKEYILSRGAKEVVMEYYDLCTGTHVGPGTLALFFFGKDRREGEAPAKKRFLGVFPTKSSS